MRWPLGFLVIFGILAVSLASDARGSLSRASAQPAVDARIEIVWPHDEEGREASVESSRLVNVEVFLFERGTLNPVSCSFANKVVLRWARNVLGVETVLKPAHDLPDDPGRAVGQRLVRASEGKTFPVWVFNDVPVAQPFIPGAKLQWNTTYFFVEIEGAEARTNVWAHGTDPRTFLSWVPGVHGPTRPTDESAVQAVDAFIAIVWPHDSQGNPRPVREANLVNIGVDLLRHTSQVGKSSVGFGFSGTVWLLRSLNDGLLEPVKPADEVITETAKFAESRTVVWPRWVFNDVDVSAARDPLNKYYFAVRVDGVETHTTIWAHGADARTYFPQVDIPARDCK